MRLWRIMSPIILQKIITHSLWLLFAMELKPSRLFVATRMFLGTWFSKYFLSYICIFSSETRKGFSNNITQCINSLYKIPEEEVSPHALKGSQGGHTTLIIHTQNCNTDYFSSSFLLPFKNSPSMRNHCITLPALHLHY